MKFFDKKDNVSPAQPAQKTPAPAPPAPAPPVSHQRPASPPPAESGVKPQQPQQPQQQQQQQQYQQPVSAPQRLTQSVIGSSLSIRGDLVADENVTIEGLVDGTVETSQDVIVASEGRVRADIFGKNVIIAGKVKGNVTATNKVDISASGQLEGNIHSPRLAIAESALFRGTINMSSPPVKPATEKEKRAASGELVKK